MKVFYETRFSYFGRSGWKSHASTNPEELFAPDRLDFRFRLFEQIALRSLSDQQDEDFTLLVLTSKLMPKPYRRQLRELCGDVLGERAQILVKPPKMAARIFHWGVRKLSGGEDWVAHVVLDDDDAVSHDFTHACKFEARQIIDNPHAKDPCAFLSFSRGLTLGIEDGRPNWVTWRNVPYTNLGLAFIAPPDHKKNPFNVPHLKVGKLFPTRVINTSRPYYIRAVHDMNDSRANVRDERFSAGEIAESFQHFPLLRQWFDETGSAFRRKHRAEADMPLLAAE